LVLHAVALRLRLLERARLDGRGLRLVLLVFVLLRLDVAHANPLRPGGRILMPGRESVRNCAPDHQRYASSSSSSGSRPSSTSLMTWAVKPTSGTSLP